ncbi:putative 3-mercaptopyruvate sulfurtransferase [Gordonia effusa NBRC 100432]|uniref:Putative 3-mercaptopyruvate sulfurtransferase n=1 Tax=Gordonia effusa NBRC 100432 TaxID=1077974 RepID=H0R3I3_9ACTN|nr:putative 3-mercaptopyruvate sulfurtransferase [Gordonia effusa NBRC 100432]
MVAELLIDPDGLADAMLSSTPPVVLDVRWQLGDPDGHQHYRAGHIPGAVFVDLDVELAGPPSPESGRHPLPELADLQGAARRWGIDDDVPVVVYDDSGNLAAARAWWLLRWGGIADVRMLDGGLGAWQSAGFRVSQGDTEPRSGAVTLTAGHLPSVTIDNIGIGGDTDAQLLDARAAERYRGEIEPVDPRAGHIPGAISAPTAENLAADGTFRSPDDLRVRFATLGINDGDDPVVYCGSGVNAAHQIAALQIAGLRGTLFAGSWSQWSADQARPVATGADETALTKENLR